MECFYNSVFPSQGQEKAYLSKILIDGRGNGVDFVWWMQPKSNFQNNYVMFDHVKRMKSWVTITLLEDNTSKGEYN